MKKKPSKPYWEMNTAELREATKEFDKPSLKDHGFGPPPPAELAKLRRAAAKRGRPITGRGAERVLLTIERGLLSRADAYAHKHGLSRAQLVARGLMAVLPKAG